ncbi:hypothetical protein bAD24_I05015 [Burkholderia sp. AD24]|nr:hypothetical protein bAD24_I05015 [Burkholderia sp. AD24]
MAGEFCALEDDIMSHQYDVGLTTKNNFDAFPRVFGTASATLARRLRRFHDSLRRTLPFAAFQRADAQ